MRQSSPSKDSAVLERIVPRSTVAADQPSLASGKMTKDLGASRVELEIGGEIVVASLGFGCLIRPVAGDYVLAARTVRGIFVLTVADRLMPDSATLSLPSGGALVVEADRISLVAREDISIDAPAIGVRGRMFNVVADTLTLLASTANWVADQLRISSKTQEVVADMISSKSLDRVTIVERTDVLRAQTLSQTIDGVAITSAPIAVIATTEDLRLDGKRVTVG